MRRLGWVTSLPREKYTILQMVHAYETTKAETRKNPVMLSKSHQEYNIYRKLTSEDKQVFIRRKLVKALEVFRARLAT